MSDNTMPPPPPVNPYGAPPPGAGGVEHPKGTTILVLGILSLVCCSPLGIAAWLMGNTAMKEIDAQPGRYSNRQTVNIGRILGMVGSALLVLTLIWIVFFGGLALLSGASNATG